MSEWTPEMVNETLKGRPFAASTIASQHNAELAAEREKRKPLVDALKEILVCITSCNYTDAMRAIYGALEYLKQ